VRKPIGPVEIYKNRRQRLLEGLKGSSLVLSSQPEFVRNGSVYHSYRADSNLYYLTGFEEPGAILVVTPHRSEPFHLFVRSKDLRSEMWDGFRYGPDQTRIEFQIESVYPVEDLKIRLPELLKGSKDLYYRWKRDASMDDLILDTLEKVRLSEGRTGLGYLSIHDSNQLLGELRVIKSSVEIENQRRACELTSEAHREVMKFLTPGQNERDIHGYFIYQIMKRGAAREGYGSIVASGDNACTLHYVFNDQPLKGGQLLLIDAGGEYCYQTADITRTYPVSGQWSQVQSEVYEGVLKIQKTLIESIRPGLSWAQLQNEAVYLLTELMLELGLFSGRLEDVMSSGDYRKYYPHGVGHYLGLDVHDSGLYIDLETRESRKLEEGMILTIEPGIYIPATESSPFKGIGIRIEDNILVTKGGYENLTQPCPKDLEDLSRIIGKG
jgi:Xaa-Pro aminopeptidase